MKPETFYRKFANLPLPKRNIGINVMTSDGYQSYTPMEIYVALNKATEDKNEAIKEIERLLEIGEKILH